MQKTIADVWKHYQIFGKTLPKCKKHYQYYPLSIPCPFKPTGDISPVSPVLVAPLYILLISYITSIPKDFSKKLIFQWFLHWWKRSSFLQKTLYFILWKIELLALKNQTFHSWVSCKKQSHFYRNVRNSNASQQRVLSRNRFIFVKLKILHSIMLCEVILTHIENHVMKMHIS